MFQCKFIIHLGNYIQLFWYHIVIHNHVLNSSIFDFQSKKDNNAFFHAAVKQIDGYTGGKPLRQAVINHICDNRNKYQVHFFLATNICTVLHV